MKHPPEIERARRLRRTQSVAEKLLWERLRRNQVNKRGVRRQAPVAGFVVDFLCYKPALIVEVDRPTHDDEEQKIFDVNRTRVLEAEGRDGRVEVGSALVALRRAGLWSLMVEGGSEVLGSFLREGLFDQVALFRAPLLLGGRGSLPAFGGRDPVRIAEARRLTSVSPLLRPRRGGPRGGDPGPGCELWYPVGRG